MALAVIEGRGAEHGRSRVIDNNVSGFTIYQVTSGRIFHLENVIVTNRSGTAEVNIYDCMSGDPSLSGTLRLRLIVGAVKTEFIGDGEAIKGCTFYSSVVAFSTVSGVWIHVGGTER